MNLGEQVKRFVLDILITGQIYNTASDDKKKWDRMQDSFT